MGGHHRSPCYFNWYERRWRQSPLCLIRLNAVCFALLALVAAWCANSRRWPLGRADAFVLGRPECLFAVYNRFSEYFEFQSCWRASRLRLAAAVGGRPGNDQPGCRPSPITALLALIGRSKRINNVVVMIKLAVHVRNTRWHWQTEVVLPFGFQEHQRFLFYRY